MTRTIFGIPNFPEADQVKELKRTFEHHAASVNLGSEQTFAAAASSVLTPRLKARVSSLRHLRKTRKIHACVSGESQYVPPLT